MSTIDSPFNVDEFDMSIFMKSADNRLDASSNVVFVRVLGSKNRLASWHARRALLAGALETTGRG